MKRRQGCLGLWIPINIVNCCSCEIIFFQVDWNYSSLFTVNLVAVLPIGVDM